MTGIAVDHLLEPVTADAPAGPDLEYDPAYRAAFDAAQGTPERQIGNTVVSGEEPDWRRVQGLASDLLTHSKDLRVAVLLTRALSRVQGLDGLESGLALLQGLMERYWDQVYPQLDPEDDFDPTARVNCLLDLCDRTLLLDALRDTPLIRSRVFGPVTYRAIEIAEGRASAPADGKALDAAAINGAFQECDGEELRSTAAAVEGALDRARSILAGLGARIRSDQMPDFDPLTGLLAAIDRALLPHVAQRFPAVSDTHAEEGATTAPSDQGSAGATQSQAAPAQIGSRDDVVRAIDRICDYYSRYEPSSPVPLLLMRARRLATGSFLDIVRDLAPSALSEIEKVCGPETEP
jgi:type VI secretion system protein ImpA